MKKTFLIASIIGIAFISNAQQEYQFTQYMSNLSYLNPAYAGSNETGSITGLFRNQWVKFDGAPKSGLITYETPFSKYNMGIGGTISYDKIGASKQLSLSINYAYHLQFESSKLAFGINAGFNHYSANFSELTVWDESDMVFSSDINGKLIPQFGFGTYYYGEKFFAGFSIPRIVDVNTANAVSMELKDSPAFNRHYYLMAGYNFKLSEQILLKTSILNKYVAGAPFQAEISALGEYQDTYSFGVSYRTGDCISPIVQYKIKDAMKIGYSYDITISKIRGYSAGTHEVLLSYTFPSKVAPKAKLQRVDLPIL